MRRTTPLTAAATLGLALLAPTALAGPATAAGETCRGEAATIVGTGADITGTEGRDVIVTGDSLRVSALGGDDLICVVPGRTGSNVLYVDAGAGADLVDTTSPLLNYFYVDTDLGPGADTLEGGLAGDWVETGDPSGVTSEVDVVRTGQGRDTVTTSGGSDVIELGPDSDYLVLDGPGTTPQGRLEGGDGHDTFAVSVTGPGEHAFDLAAGAYRTAGASADFSSFESLRVDARGAAVAIAGTESDDYVTVRTEGPEPSSVVADLAGGDDDLMIAGTKLAAGSRIELGSGEDNLVAARTSGTLELDLTRGELEAMDVTVPASGVEDGFLIARKVRMAGDGRDNSLIAYACQATIVGRGGDDELIWDEDYVFEEYTFRCRPSTTMRGGRGKDTLYGDRGEDRLFGGDGADTIRGDSASDTIRGGKGADRVEAGRGHDDVRGGSGADTLLGEDGRDVLIGERGRDLANGGAGRDRCVAERERRCER